MHLNKGDQLVHSPFLQSLASLAIGLDQYKIFCRSPGKHYTSPSNLELSAAPEWSWMRSFNMALRVADCLTYRTAFPKYFAIPDMDRVCEDEALQPFVSFAF